MANSYAPDVAAHDWYAVTPNDSADLPQQPKALYVGVSGDVVIVSRNGREVTIKDAYVGYHPMSPVRVKATGTTATNIVSVI